MEHRKVGAGRYVAGDFGPEPHINDVSAEPGSMEPTLKSAVVADMQSMGLDPAFMYAFQHTGYLVTNETIDRYSDAQLLGWQAAIERYRAVAY